MDNERERALKSTFLSWRSQTIHLSTQKGLDAIIGSTNSIALSMRMENGVRSWAINIINSSFKSYFKATTSFASFPTTCTPFPLNSPLNFSTASSVSI